MKQVSRQTGALADTAIAEWQTAEVAKATAAGSTAGTQDNVTYRPGTSLTSTAFNVAAKKTQATMTELKTTTGMTELAEVYKRDPAQFKLKSQEFIDATVENLTRAGNPQLANVTKAKMALSAQTEGYKVSKAYVAEQVDKAKADNETLLHTLKVNTYKGSGGIFSADPEEQGIALTNFAVNKKLYDASLHAVLPDGTPVYSATAIQKRQQAFHSDFYTGAVQNWVSEANLSTADLKKIKDGTLIIDIPGAGAINVLDEVGVDDYDKKVRKYTVTKIREEVAAQAKLATLNKALMTEAQKANDIAMLNDIYNGSPMSSSEIVNGVANGKVSLTTAKSALKMLNDPNMVHDDIELVHQIKLQQIKGEDVTDIINANSNRISSNTYKELVTYDVSTKKSLQNEDEKWITREMVKKDAYGIEDPKSLRLAVDTVDSYRQKIKDGKSPQVAFEEVRNTMDALKDRANIRMYNSVPRYSVIKDGKVDAGESIQETLKAFNEGRIDEETFNIEMDRFDKLLTERGINAK